MAKDRGGERWEIWSSHGKVLFFVARNSMATVDEIAEAVDLSGRRVIAVLKDLSDAGILRSTRRGYRRRYELAKPSLPLHPLLAITIEDFLSLTAIGTNSE